MKERHANLEKFNAFSYGIFGVLITLRVLDLKVPDSPTLNSFLALWPTGLSYGVSYLFVAIVWMNHHYLLGYAEMTTNRLIWVNFAHLFVVSFVPFLTTWIAKSSLAPFPVCVYAADFVLVEATYIALCWEIADCQRGAALQKEMGRKIPARSFSTLAVFTLAAIASLKWPAIGMALICCCLLVYIEPKASGIETKTE